MMGRILLALMIVVMLISCVNKKTINNDIREIKNTTIQQTYPSIIPLPYKIETRTIKPKKLELIVRDVETPKPKFITFEVTAYTANYESTGKRKNDPQYGVTASGNKVKENYTIACPKSMEFGTKVYIPYFENTFTCEDRGGKIKEGHIDVYMKDFDKAMDFGRQQLAIYIVRKDGV